MLRQISIRLLSNVFHYITICPPFVRFHPLHGAKELSHYKILPNEELSYREAKRKIQKMKITSLSVLSGLVMSQGYGTSPAGTVFTDLLFKSLMECQEWINEVRSIFIEFH